MNAGEDEADKILDPSDLIGTFSDGTDADGNGYVDDIAGWDFFGDDNDPFDASDCCQNGHGTDRAEEAAAETNNGEGGAGVCPECMVMPLRTSDSIVHDTNLIALATVYAADNGASHHRVLLRRPGQLDLRPQRLRLRRRARASRR